MSEPRNRRTFLKWSAASVAAVGAGCSPDDTADGVGTAAEGSPPAPLPSESLRAAADVALPDELGPDGKARVVHDFEAWVDGFSPVAEQVHGYGSQEIAFGPPDPRPRWAAQLQALDLEAAARYGRPFAELERAARRALVETVLEAERGGLGSRPAALEAPHVIVGLLGFFFGSPEALDLGYRRRIGAFSCRPLQSSGDIPPPVEGDGAARPGTATSAATDGPALREPRSPRARIEPGLEPGS